jgi:hypothetical protein
MISQPTSDSKKLNLTEPSRQPTQAHVATSLARPKKTKKIKKKLTKPSLDTSREHIFAPPQTKQSKTTAILDKELLAALSGLAPRSPQSNLPPIEDEELIKLLSKPSATAKVTAEPEVVIATQPLATFTETPAPAPIAQDPTVATEQKLSDPKTAYKIRTKEELANAIESMRKTPISNSDIDTHRLTSLEAFANKIQASESIEELNEQFSYLRKLHQFTINFLHISYTGATEQRKIALQNVSSTIKSAFEAMSTGQKTEKDAYAMVRDTELANRKDITEDYAKNSWWKFTLGRLTGSESTTANKLKSAAEDAEKEPASPMFKRS